MLINCTGLIKAQNVRIDRKNNDMVPFPLSRKAVTRRSMSKCNDIVSDHCSKVREIVLN